jgi:hypothetical protein
MSQILLRRLSTHSHSLRGHGCRRLSSAVYGGGGRRRAGPGAAPPQDDESSRAVRVSVWWDFENCNIPNGVNVYRVAPRVSAALRAAGIRGPLSITAFGDVLQLARSSQEALAATGVSISHVPSSCVVVPPAPFNSAPFRSIPFCYDFGNVFHNFLAECAVVLKKGLFCCPRYDD